MTQADGGALMVRLYLWIVGPVVVGTALALLWWRLGRGRTALPAGATAALAVCAGVLVVVGEVGTRLMSAPFLLPFSLPEVVTFWNRDLPFTQPLLIGILGLALLALPVQARRGRGTADLTRRSLTSFARPRWIAVPGALLALLALVTVLAGVASEPDPARGRYTMYTVQTSETMSIGASIYGWYYSVPALVLTAVLIGVLVLAMWSVARPALAEDRARDTRERTLRTRNLLAAFTGTLLVHLGQILTSLAGTASMRGTVVTSEGSFSFWPSFSALGPVFTGTSLLCCALGVALWATVALSALPSRRGVPVMVGP